MTTDTAYPVTFENLAKLPRGVHLLIAYALITDQWELLLMSSDKDMLTLLAQRWITVRPSPTKGILTCEFVDSAWEGLEAIERKILSSVTEDELERFKARKSKAYPWTW